jgi:phosphatidylserine/phosphatidylglycerophosphate/cardiolipin synthase-like enzyme
LEAASLDRLWPDDVEPDLTDVDVAIARTFPPTDTAPGVRECERLFVDSIAAARESIYIESQYFTNGTLARALAARLQDENGPELIVVIPQECHGWVEQETMGALRDEALHLLVAADRWRRLRVVYPAASCARGVATFVHSKVMIVDDWFVRIGSANFSHRSMGVDSECDLAIDAASDPEHRAGVLRIRNRLIAEHLGASEDTVTQEIRDLGSLRELVDAHADGDRTLCRVDLSKPADPPPDALRAAADPDEPLDVVAETGVRKVWRRLRLLPRYAWSLVPARLRSSAAKRRRADVEYG